MRMASTIGLQVASKSEEEVEKAFRVQTDCSNLKIQTKSDQEAENFRKCFRSSRRQFENRRWIHSAFFEANIEVIETLHHQNHRVVMKKTTTYMRLEMRRKKEKRL